MQKVRFSCKRLLNFRQSWLNGDFESLPEIEIRFQEELGGANGAFAVSTNKIYLSEEYISQNSFNSGAIVDVLLEEVGHFVDANINQLDTVGDEGEIFSAVVQDIELNEASLKLLKAKNDINVVKLDNQKIKVEQNNENPSVLSYDDVEISFRAFIPSPTVSLDILPGSFGGDNRSFQYDSDSQSISGTPPVSSRAYQSVVVNVDPSRPSAIVGEPQALWGETKEYSIGDTTSVPDKPFWWTQSLPGAEPIKQATLQTTKENNNIEVNRISNDEIEVKLTLDGGNPLLPDLVPNINSEFSIFIREKDPLGLPEYRVEGLHDGFPAYELYINKERVYEHDPVARTQNPLSLNPPMEWDTADTSFQTVPLVLDDSNFTFNDTNSNSNDSTSTVVDNFIKGINDFFPNLTNTIDDEIFTNDIPLIGDIFSSDTVDSLTEVIPQNSPIPQNASEDKTNPLNFIKQIQEAIVKELEELKKLGAGAGAKEIQKALTDALGADGLNILKGQGITN